MRFCLKVSLFFTVFVFTPRSGSAQTQAQTTPDQQPLSLGEIARQYQLKKQSNASGAAQIGQTEKDLTASSDFSKDEEQYKLHIREILKQQNFAELERLAAEARDKKGRFAGGVWKLYMFYDAFTAPAVSGRATAADWQSHFGTLNAWMAAQPTSITAPVALARAYIGFGSDARGTGFADTVTETGWQLDAEYTEKARKILVAASRLKKRCPYWYEAMQQVALSQGWDKAQARALFNEAVSLEPDYYHYYREYANYLLPKWYGDEGEVEEFANEVASRVSGQQGLFLYFELASVINCQCGDDEVHMVRMSWPKIKQGYEALQQLYGSTNLKENRFAYLTTLARDKSAAQEVFTRLGYGWNPQTWRSQQTFETARAWALSQ